MFRALTLTVGLLCPAAPSAQPVPSPSVDVQPAVLLHTCLVLQLAREAGAPTMEVRYLVSAAGALASTSISKSSGNPRHDEAVLAELLKCRFLPAWVSGQAAEGVGRLILGAAPAPAAARQNARITNALECAPKAEDYPALSKRVGEQGTTRLRFTIGTTGALVGVAVVRSSGFPRLDEAAAHRLSMCKFLPALGADGSALDSTFDVEYVWKLT